MAVTRQQQVKSSATFLQHYVMNVKLLSGLSLTKHQIDITTYHEMVNIPSHISDKVKFHVWIEKGR